MKRTEENKRRVSKALKGRVCYWLMGDKNPMRRPEIVAQFKGKNAPMANPVAAEKVAAWHRGRKESKETCEKFSAIRKAFFTGEQGAIRRQRMSEMAKKMWEDPLIRASMREKFSKGDKKKWEDEEYKARRIAQMKTFPKKDTQIERLLQEELVKRGIAFLTHVPMGIARPDLYLPDYGIVIQADGCYWHRCPIHLAHLSHRLPPEKHDEMQNIHLRERGLKVFRFWEHEIKSSVVECIDRLNLGEPTERKTIVECEVT